MRDTERSLFAIAFFLLCVYVILCPAGHMLTKRTRQVISSMRHAALKNGKAYNLQTSTQTHNLFTHTHKHTMAKQIYFVEELSHGHSRQPTKLKNVSALALRDIPRGDISEEFSLGTVPPTHAYMLSIDNTVK